MTDEMIADLKMAVAGMASATAAGLTPGMRANEEEAQEIVNRIVPHLTVEIEDKAVTIRYDLMALIRMPPFYGMLPSVLGTPTVQKWISGALENGPLLRGYTVSISI